MGLKCPGDKAELRRDFRNRQREESLASTLRAGIVALFAVPVWAIFDRMVVPEEANHFLVARVVAEIAVAIVLFALWHQRNRLHRVEALSFLLASSLVIPISWMVPQAKGAVEGYLLALSLPFYATASIVFWRWRMTASLTLVSFITMAWTSAEVAVGLTHLQWTIAVFYLTTAASLAGIAQVYRERSAWEQHVTQAELEAERHLNHDLVYELERLSQEDPLTAVGNRRAWDKRLNNAVLKAQRSGQPLSVLLCDLDHFKSVNDNDGHEAGDTLLRTAATILVARCRGEDFVARIGGDEFMVLCPNTSLTAAAALAEQIRTSIRDEVFLDPTRMTCSIGVAELDRAGDSAEGLCRRADTALYRAKTHRDAVRCSEPLRASRLKDRMISSPIEHDVEVSRDA